MVIDEKILWKQLEDFPLDDPNSALNFTARLARDNSWPLHFAQRVTAAYKKFIFLCMVSPTQVTPSDAVDQAWHLHMTYTESYWTDLCAKILGRQLHHNPTKGGQAENEKFFDQYEATLQLYREKFEEEPPADIWPPAHQRFSDTDFVRVNRKHHLVIRKPRRKGILPAVLVAAAGIAISAVTGAWTFMFIAGPAALLLMANDRAAGPGSSSSYDGPYDTGWNTDGGPHHSGGGHHGCGGSHGCGSGCSSGCGSGCGGGCGGGCSS
jgi:hypothetical protein